MLECFQVVWELNHERANQSILPRIKINLLLHVPAIRMRMYGSCLTELRTISLSDFDLDSSAVLHQNRWSRVRVGHTIARYIDLDSMERSAPSNTLRRGISWGFKIWQNLNPSTREVALLSLRSENLENRRGFYFSEIRISEKIAGVSFFGKSPEKIAIWVFIFSKKKSGFERFPLS